MLNEVMWSINNTVLQYCPIIIISIYGCKKFEKQHSAQKPQGLKRHRGCQCPGHSNWWLGQAGREGALGLMHEANCNVRYFGMGATPDQYQDVQPEYFAIVVDLTVL
jgi:hypothetical protein